jgi:hypothetical protein
MLTLMALRGTWIELDLYQFEPVNLNYKFTDLEQLNAPASSYSQTFRLPLTKTNEAVFGPFDLSQVPSFDLKTRTQARIMKGGVPLITGYLQVKSWYLQKGQFVDLEVAFFGEAADLSRTIGDATLDNLNFTTENHTVNFTNVTNSWAGTLQSGAFRYGLVDRLKNWDATTNPGTAALQPTDMTPFIRVKTVLDKIFSTAGFTYSSAFFTAQTDLYLMLHNGGPSLKFVEDVATAKFWVGRTTNLTLTAPTAWTDVTLQEGAPFYDYGTDYAAPTWTVPFAGLYVMNFYFNYTLSSPGAAVAFRLTNGTTHYTLNNVYTVLTQYLTGGSTWKLQVQVSAGNITLNAGGGTLGVGGTSWKIAEALPSTNTLDVSRNFPKVRQMDFLAGLQKCFNLVFIPDRYDPKKIYIEPYTDYMAAGDVKDWTNLIDLSQDVQVNTTADRQKRTYEWTHSEGEDFLNAAVQASGRVYGRHRILDPGNAFASGEQKIESGFAPFATSYIPGTAYNVARILSDDGEKPDIAELKPRLAFWNGQLTAPFLLDNAGSSSSQNMPFFGQFNTNNTEDADVPGDSLMFGIELPFFSITANPYNTLYNKYWQQYSNQLYSSDARILTASFRLTTAEISTFEFSDKIYLFNTYWRVLEITGFDPTVDGVCKVQLLKILGTMRDCTYLPSTGRTGRIEFTQPNGSSIFTVSRECCEKYGFFYSSSSANCFQP